MYYFIVVIVIFLCVSNNPYIYDINTSFIIKCWFLWKNTHSKTNCLKYSIYLMVGVTCENIWQQRLTIYFKTNVYMWKHKIARNLFTFFSKCYQKTSGTFPQEFIEYKLITYTVLYSTDVQGVSKRDLQLWSLI